MSWRCPTCGFVNNDTKSQCEAMCGYARLGRLVLTCDSTGRQLRMAIQTAIGKRLLATLGSDEAKFASDPQFHATPDTALGCWVVRHAPSAVNRTFLNGRPLTTATPLEAGAALSVDQKLKLTVRFEV